MKKKNRIWILPLTISLCLPLLTSCEKEPEQGTVTDNEGNVYQTVKIGDQWWMAENLKTTKYNDDTAIPNIAGITAWQSLLTGAYCWFNNDESANKDTYGALYNWHAVSSDKLCPSGWHVPSDAEWTTLENYLGGIAVVGMKLKEAGNVHWASPNTGATNESGFTALPGGYRSPNGDFYNGAISGSGVEAEWFSSTEKSDIDAFLYYVYKDNTAGKAEGRKTTGCSIRCIKN